MNFVLILAGAFLILGVLAYVVAQWPEQSASKRKKEKKEVLPSPLEIQKDAAVAAERFERRIRMLENSLVVAQNEQKEKLKEIEGLKVTASALESQVRQEKAWREKEEAFVIKEKKVEQDLRVELDKTRTMLHEESNQRIRLEYEVKELRQVKDALSADLRKINGHNNDLESRVKGFVEETRALKVENVQLKEKKEANQWVAKDDYDKLERLLKWARDEVEQLKRRLPVDLRDLEKKE